MTNKWYNKNRSEGRYIMNYVLYGSEEYLITKRITEIISNSVKLQDSVTYLDMKDVSLEFALEEAQMIPLFEDKKVIVMRHASFLGTKGAKGNELEQLIEYCSATNPQTVLILVADDGIDERKKLIKELRSLIKFEEFKSLDDMDRKQYVNGYIKKHSINVLDSAKSYLLSVLPNDMRAMHGELEKLALYDGMVDESIIRMLVTRPLEDDVFKLVNAVINRNMKQALLIWQDFLVLNKEPLALIGALAAQFRFCYQVAALKMEGYSEHEIANKLECKPYRVTKTMESIRGTSPERFLRYLNELSILDTGIKSGKIDKKLGFELFLLKVGGTS